MTQKDALALCIGMVNAFAGVVVAFQGDALPATARLLAAALVASCGFGLMFLDKIGGQPDDEPAARRRSPTALASEFMVMSPADRVKFMARVQKIREAEARGRADDAPPPHG